MKAENPLLRLLRRLSHALRSVVLVGVVVAFGLLLLTSVSQAILRNLGQSVPVWLDPLSHRLVLWVGLLGAILAVSTHSHIKLDLAAHLLPDRIQAGVQRGLALLSAGVCGLLAKASLTFVQAEAALSDATLAGVPSWIFAVIIPLSFGAMALQFGLEAVVPTESERQPLRRSASQAAVAEAWKREEASRKEAEAGSPPTTGVER